MKMRRVITLLQLLLLRTSVTAASPPALSPSGLDRALSELNEIYAGMTVRDDELGRRPRGVDDEGVTPQSPTPTVAIARSRLPDDEPCESVEGLWLSSSLEVMVEVRATETVGRLYVRVVGSDWTGRVESLFGGLGPVTAFVSRPDAGDAATFVGHCRVSDHVDTITGVWVVASSDKNALDHHLAVQPIPDTLHRLNVG